MLQLKTILISEAISTQTDGFGKRLEGIVQIIVDYIKDTPESKMNFGTNNAMIKELEKALFTRLKIKTHIVTDSILAAIMPFYSNKYHIFLDKYWHGKNLVRDQDRMLDELDGEKGFVNLEKAQLGGFFSEYEHTVYMNFWNLVNVHGMQTDEIVAVLLHEIGHGFKACYYADRTDRTNQALANVARHLKQNTNKGDIEYVYKELKVANPSIRKEEVDKMLNGNVIISNAAWFRNSIGVVRSLTVNDKYNETSFEAEADSFASRFGYGRSIILALEKLSKGSPEKSRAMLLFIQVMSVVPTALLLALMFTAGSVVSGAFFTLLFLNTIFGSGDNNMDMTYDELKIRYQRIRNDTINQLKELNLPRERTKELLDSIRTMDNVIKNTHTVNTFPRWISNLLSSKARAARASISDQQIMETLASNDIFVQAAKMRTLA